MRTHAHTVIIGAGIAGCAMACHLAALGRRDIVVVDAGPLFHTGGSTSHAPGGLSDIALSRMMFQFGRYSLDLYAELSTDDGPAAKLLGGVETAQTPERWAELKRRAGWAKSWGGEADLLTPAECREAYPLLEPSKLMGGLFVHQNGIGWPVRAAQAMAARAGDAAEFYGKTRVNDIETVTERGVTRVRAVVTDQGAIETEEIVLCAGIWGPVIGRMAGVDIPLQPMQHQYVIFDPIPELAGRNEEVSLPVFRARDQDVYLRTHFDRLGLGNYNHTPRPVDAETLKMWAEGDPEPARLPFLEDDFKVAHEAITDQLPCLDGLGLSECFNGVFSFTPDGLPLLGEAADVKGFWVAEALWITHAAGAARALAEWMVDGQPSLDVGAADLNRFHPYARRPDYVRLRGGEAYINVHAVIHPAEPMRRPRNLRLSPFHAAYEEHGAEFVDGAGWERPQWCEANAGLNGTTAPQREGWAAMYWSPVQALEHRHTREAASLFDLSAYMVLEVSGAGAAAYLNRVCTNQMDVTPGRLIYTAIADPAGGVVADAMVTRLDWDRYWLTLGAVHGPRQTHWLRGHIDDGERVTLVDVSAQWCTLGLWGPASRTILSSVSANNLSNDSFPYFTAQAIEVGPVPVLAQRVSYVGELGWELFTQPEFAASLWQQIWQAGREHGLIAAGAGAVDSLRLEKGFRRYGADLDRDHNVIEAGLGATVRLDKQDFVGRDALTRARDGGPAQTLVCLAMQDDQAHPMGGEPVIAEGHTIGHVTSGNTGYSVGQSLAFAYLDAGHGAPGTAVEIEIFAESAPAQVVADPAFDPDGARMRQ